MNELEQMRQVLKVRREAHLRKLQELYRYAKEKGFSTEESQYLSHKSKEAIDRLFLLKEEGKK